MSMHFDILLVEDEPVIIEAATKVLLSEGLRVQAVFDAELAMQKLQQNQYDLIISDLMLPNISGIELLEKVKSIDPTTPFIVITGFATLENAVRSFKVGAFDFLPKPFDAEELLGVVVRALRHHELARGLSGQQNGFKSKLFREVGHEGEKTYFLGQHSWARIDRDGVTWIGVAETFQMRMGRIKRLEFPTVDAEVLQGNLCTRIVTEKAVTHMVWAPLSGKVIETNPDVEQNVELLNSDPFGLGWLVKVIPTNLENELENLTVR